MTQTLNVEYDELISRAQELEKPMPPPPADNPRPPCTLPFVNDAATQLALSADSMRLYLAACEREWRRLATSLRNAAKAYEEVDEEAADSITNETNMKSGGASMVAFCDPDEDWGGWTPPPPPPPPPPVQVPYYEVRQAATDIESPDQGTGFEEFAKYWDVYQRNLQTTTYRFRPFTNWEGTSATLVEANFAAHRTWIYSVAQSISAMAAQAKTVRSAHLWAITQHPSSYEVWEADKWYMIYKTDPYYKNNPNTPYYLSNMMQWYADMQAKSEEVLGEYVKRGGLPLPPVYPTPPPSAYRIDPPAPKPNPDDPDNPDNPDVPDPDIPGPDDDYNDTPSTPTTPSTPSVPTTPSTSSTGVPPLGDEFKDALAAATAGAGGEPTLKPASVGAGGGGGGIPGSGIPSMPLQPSVGAESVAPAGPGGRGMPGAGGGMPGAGGAMGGGPMGGMAPMAGAGAGGQGNKEGKRGPEADESLYEEDRAWTEAVIGNRRRKDAPEK